MRYALLVCYDENAKISADERSMRASGLGSVSELLSADGALISGFRLQSASTAATVRCWDGGDVMVRPGPATAPGEQLEACFVVDCAGVEAAIELATGIPAAWYGSVEIRPLVTEPGQLDPGLPECQSVTDCELHDLDDY